MKKIGLTMFWSLNYNAILVLVPISKFDHVRSPSLRNAWIQSLIPNDVNFFYVAYGAPCHPSIFGHVSHF